LQYLNKQFAIKFVQEIKERLLEFWCKKNYFHNLNDILTFIFKVESTQNLQTDQHIFWCHMLQHTYM